MIPASPAREHNSPIPAAAGIGLRFPHHDEVLRTRPAIAWLEVHAENFFGGGTPRRVLEQVRCDYPLSLHGVGLSLGSAGDLDVSHLARLSTLTRDLEPGLVSEHLSWSVVDGEYLADLLPLPLTEEALALVCRHIDQAQEHLQRRILIENPSTYVQYRHSTVPEWEFLAALAARTGCGVLCDVNNIFVSASNHGWDPLLYLQSLPVAAIGEIHLAGHALRTLDSGRVVRIDNHGSPVCDEVWSLYRAALERFGSVPSLIEWDTDLPPLSRLLEQAARANSYLSGAPTHACAA